MKYGLRWPPQPLRGELKEASLGELAVTRSLLAVLLELHSAAISLEMMQSGSQTVREGKTWQRGQIKTTQSPTPYDVTVSWGWLLWQKPAFRLETFCCKKSSVRPQFIFSLPDTILEVAQRRNRGGMIATFVDILLADWPSLFCSC